jgi:hypothetical protein
MGLILGVLLTLWIIIQVAWITLSSFLPPLFLVMGLTNIFIADDSEEPSKVIH